MRASQTILFISIHSFQSRVIHITRRYWPSIWILVPWNKNWNNSVFPVTVLREGSHTVLSLPPPPEKVSQLPTCRSQGGETGLFLVCTQPTQALDSARPGFIIPNQELCGVPYVTLWIEREGASLGWLSEINKKRTESRKRRPGTQEGTVTRKDSGRRRLNSKQRD